MGNEKISVIIPCYREPEYLDLCLQSCIEGQVNQNEIIIVCDGYFDENKEVIDRWKDHISVIEFETNQGLPRATNIGVYNASSEWILVVNDDNVFPKGWDKELEHAMDYYTDKKVIISPNQIEPNPSIFPQFHIHDLGKHMDEFDLDKFWDYVNILEGSGNTETGGTLPIFMKRVGYIALGGWDESYPTNGVVADWDFFLKAEINGYKLLRDYTTHFYHFAQVATGTQRQETEQYGHEYFRYKWHTNYIPLPLRNLSK
jgi:glycosyltransferase involved in cell wall biosynthesis